MLENSEVRKIQLFRAISEIGICVLWALQQNYLRQNPRVLLPEIQLALSSSIRISRKVERIWHLAILVISKMVEMLITRQGQADATGNEIENLESTNGELLHVVNPLDRQSLHTRAI